MRKDAEGTRNRDSSIVTDFDRREFTWRTNGANQSLGPYLRSSMCSKGLVRMAEAEAGRRGVRAVR